MEKPSELPVSYRWRILAATCFAYIVYTIIVFNIPPILGNIIDSLHISHTAAGFLMSIAILPAFLFSLPVGLIVDRYGARMTGTIALAIMILGTSIVALGNNYWILILGRFIIGSAATGLIISMPKLLTSWFAAREMGLAMGVYNTAFPLGNIIAINFAGVMAYNMGWRIPVWLCAFLGIVALLIYVFLIRDRKDQQINIRKSRNLFNPIRQAGWKIWCVAITWGFFGAGVISFFTYAPDYFVSIGKSVELADLIASAPMFGSILLASTVGFLLDRLGRKRLFIVTGIIGISLLLFLIPRVPGNELLVAILLGVFIAIFTPSIFSLPGEILPHNAQGVGFSVIIMCQSLGNVLGPITNGAIRDLTGDYYWSFVSMAIMVLMGIIPMVILLVYRRNQIDPTRAKS
jgi:predicted MFS family arabinose efflux permease